MNKKLIISDLSLVFGDGKDSSRILSNINFDLEESEIGIYWAQVAVGKHRY